MHLSTKFSYLNNLSEDQLVKEYRKTPSRKLKSKIFELILFRKRRNGKSWHDNIQIHVRENAFRIDFYNTSFEKDDLYQEVLKAFQKMIERWYDPDSKTSFSTYMWYVINTAVNRVFQTSRTKKRNIDGNMSQKMIDINGEYSKNRKVAEVLSDKGNGSFLFNYEKGLMSKICTPEELFLRKDLFNYLERIFDEEKIIESELSNRISELIYKQKRKVADEVFENIATEFKVSVKEVYNLKEKIERNFEKKIFKDILRFITLEIKNDGILAEKYGCSRGQITKMKQKLSKICKRQFKIDNISMQDYLT